MKKFQAFTMAEAILVMTILGIIATIMITTLRPAEFQEKGLQILAKKVLSEIDTATSQVLFNDSADSTFEHLYKKGTTTLFTAPTNGSMEQSDELVKLYKKYLVTVRKTNAANHILYLKNGARASIIFQKMGNMETIFPGESNMSSSPCPYGIIYLDTNGDNDPPNLPGKDLFQIPLANNGIKYAD